MTTIHFFFDFQSPYSYLCWKDVQRRKSEWAERGLQLRYYPLSMGSLISSYETLGPAQIPPKRDFLFRQCLRRAKEMGVPLRTPSRLPFNPVEVLRLGTVSASGSVQGRVIDAVFKATWCDQVDMEDQKALSTYLQDQLKFCVHSTLEGDVLKMARKEIKENLKLAKGYKAFGVPSLVVHDELFWGHDSLEDFNRFLKGEDLLDRDEYHKFLALF